MDRIKQLAKKYGVKLSNRSCDNNFSFNGKTIAMFESRLKVRSDSDLIHDIAHFVVADTPRRRLPDFGLGSGVDSGDLAPFAEGMTGLKAQIEEELASALGIWWERELGMDWRKTFEFHSWILPFIDMPQSEQEIFNLEATHKFADRLRELKKRQII